MLGGLSRKLVRGCAAQPESERRALADAALHRDVAAHQTRQPAADGEAKPGTAFRAGVSALCLNERLEDAYDLFRRNSDAGVRDPHECPRTLSNEACSRIGVLRGAAAQRDRAAGIRELHRVRKEI